MTLDELFNEHRSQLGENDLYIWNYITAHRRECAALPIETLGRRCNVSRTTILRFARKLGLHGFSELKVLLRMEEKPQQAQPDYIEQTCAVYCRHDCRDIRAKDCTALFRLHRRRRKTSMCFRPACCRTRSPANCAARFSPAESGFTPSTRAPRRTCAAAQRDRTGSGHHPVRIGRVPAGAATGARACACAASRPCPSPAGGTIRSPSCVRCSYMSAPWRWKCPCLGTQYQSTTSFFILVELLFLKYLAYRNGGDHEAGRPDRAELP